jgi:small-conductance mechanosensitive channel
MSFLLPTGAELGAGVGLLRHAAGIGVIAATTWIAVALVDAGARIIARRHDVSRADNLEARRVHTQVQVLERTLIVVIVILGLAAMLMTFPRVREVGQSLLVSAGVAGLAIGLAARPVLENIIAGLQLAFTQPIRVDDVVIVEGEWGRIEEITATYVVVAIWDERRLIVPFSRFISQPFQNWTRRSADILGTVFLHADYTVPVDAVRAELERLCADHPLWDGRVCVLQVTNASERTVELRALVSAKDSGQAWDLRVDLREQLIAFLQREHPDALPRMRFTGSEPAPAHD